MVPNVLTMGVTTCIHVDPFIKVTLESWDITHYNEVTRFRSDIVNYLWRDHSNEFIEKLKLPQFLVKSLTTVLHTGLQQLQGKVMTDIMGLRNYSLALKLSVCGSS